jgi:predicted DNA-binding protein YlxM (UPF0122 family)
MQNTLTEKEIAERRKEMALLTQQGYSLNQIAKKYNVSRQRIHQILQKAKEEGCEVVVYKQPKKTKECVVCKKQYYRKFRTKTCSKDCTLKLLRKGGKWSRYEFFTFTCENCNKEFKRSHYRESIANVKCKKDGPKFCSKECYWSSNFFKQVGKYKGIENAKNPKKRNSL